MLAESEGEPPRVQDALVREGGGGGNSGQTRGCFQRRRVHRSVAADLAIGECSRRMVVYGPPTPVPSISSRMLGQDHGLHSPTRETPDGAAKDKYLRRPRYKQWAQELLLWARPHTARTMGTVRAAHWSGP